jgi:hypothetical protein
VAQPNPVPVTDPVAQAGPYEVAANGTCAQGHPLNSTGRCQPLNAGTEQQPPFKSF